MFNVKSVCYNIALNKYDYKYNFKIPTEALITMWSKDFPKWMHIK